MSRRGVVRGRLGGSQVFIKMRTYVPMGGGHMSHRPSPKAPLPFMTQAYQFRANITPDDAVYAAPAEEVGCAAAGARRPTNQRARPPMPDPCPLKPAVSGRSVILLLPMR